MELFEGEERYLLVCLKSDENTLSYYWYPKRRISSYERYFNDDIIECFRTKKELKTFLKGDLFEQYDGNNMKYIWDIEVGESFVGDDLKLNYYNR